METDFSTSALSGKSKRFVGPLLPKGGKNLKQERKLRAMVRNEISQSIRNRQELKSFDNGIGSTFSSTGTISRMFSPAQDDSDEGREGDSCTLVKLTGNFYATVADTTNVCRITIFRWNSNSGSDAPAISDVYQTSASPFISEFVRDNLRSGILEVHYDEMVIVSGNGPQAVFFPKLNLKWKANKVNFDVGSTDGKGMWYVAISSDSTASTHPGVIGYARFWYTDS